jgi:hypothetical protein
LRNIYEPGDMAKHEFQYSGVGRGTVSTEV